MMELFEKKKTFGSQYSAIFVINTYSRGYAIIFWFISAEFRILIFLFINSVTWPMYIAVVMKSSADFWFQI